MNDSSLRHANAARALVAAHYTGVRMKSTPYKSERHQALAQDEPAAGVRISFPRLAPSSCTGNCNQGRACDCVADVESAEPETRWRPSSLALAIVLVLAIAVLCLVVPGGPK